MQGWRIFIHSLRMIFGNLGAAFRISLVLYLVQVSAAIYFTSKFGGIIKTLPTSAGPQGLPQGFWSSWALLVLVSTVTSLWIAVSWHRYVLLRENPSAVLPPFNGARIWEYFWVSLFLGIVVGIAAIVPVLIGGFIIAGLLGPTNSPTAQILMLIVVAGVMTYVFYRLCLILPAAALGKSKRMGESWADTRPATGAIWQLIAITILAIMLVEFPSYLNSDPASIVNIIYTYVVGWIVMMVGISVMTTLYGVYAEGREL